MKFQNNNIKEMSIAVNNNKELSIFKTFYSQSHNNIIVNVHSCHLWYPSAILGCGRVTN